MKNLERLSAVASGRDRADIVFHGASVLNVFTREWEKKDIALCGQYIAAVAEPGMYRAEQEMDVTGKWITPGFIDAHVHIESSMVLPGEFARTVAKHGTTAVIADSHEIANVLGPDAVRFMIRQSERAPADIYFMIPSCVPATDFEHTGGVISVADITSILKMPRVIGLGEMMNYPGIINGDLATLDKLSTVFNMAGECAVIDGHAPLVRGRQLQAYRSVGIRTDHECHTFDEAAEKIRSGMYILIRQGSSARDLELIVPELAKSNLPVDRFCFCTDDKNIADIIREGHIDSNIRNAIRLGLRPEDAYTMASLNAAECYHLNDTGAVCAGYKADFVILDDEETVAVNSVVKAGVRPETEQSVTVKLSETRSGSETEELLYRACHSIHLEAAEITASMFDDSVSPIFGRYAIAIHPGTLNTEKKVLKDGEAERGLREGTMCRLAVIERHKKTGCHSMALLSGYGLSRGAIAMSIGHDSHNIICAGIRPEDMKAAVARICTMQGGIVIVRDAMVTAELALPVAGLMSNEPAVHVQSAHDALLPAARDLGIYKDTEPFVTLSFLALTVIPELRLTDCGLFDVCQWKFL
jgi:adenine deaminase